MCLPLRTSPSIHRVQMKGAHSRRCSIASSALLVLLLAGCCLCSPARTPRPQVGSAENTTGNQKEPKKLQKDAERPADVWWANPCAVPGGGERETPRLSSSEEDIMLEMGGNLTDKWVIQLKNAIHHIKMIEKRYEEHLSKDDIGLVSLLEDNIELDLQEIQHHFAAEDFSMKWLPTISDNYEIAKSKTVKVVTDLYKGLQRFAVTIECMMGQSGCNQKRMKKKKNKQITKAIHQRLRNKPLTPHRTALLEEIKVHLSTLLCEVQYFLRNVKKTGKLPVPPRTGIVTWDMSQTDTEQLVLEVGILMKYKNYLLQWEKITNNLLKSVDPATRNKHKKKRDAKKTGQQQQGARSKNAEQTRGVNHGQGNGGRRRIARRNRRLEQV